MATTVYTNNQYYTDIATAIRSKNGSNTQYKPSEMAGAINALIVSGSAPRLQSKTVSPTTSQQTISYDSGYNGLSSVTINAISPIKSATDVTVSGATVSIPYGYYSSAVSKSVVTGSAGTPTASKGTVSNNSISITPSVTNTTGYITGGTKTGTAVTVSASELVSGTLSITTNGTKNVANYANVNVNVPVGATINNQNKTVTPSTSSQSISADSGYTGLGTVTVNAIPSQYIVPSGSQTVTSNNTYDVTSLAEMIVNVPTGSTINNQNKTVNPSTSQQTVTADSGYTGLGTVTVNAMTVMTLPAAAASSRSGTNKATIGRSTSAQYINIPIGYNSAAASYTISAVENGSVANPTATKGTVSNNSISITPSVTSTTGYITGGTKTGTAVTVTASELVSGNKAITANGTNIDVTNYATVDVNVSSSGGVVKTITLNDSSLWVSNSTFTESSSAGASYVSVMHTDAQSGNRITLLDPIPMPATTITVYGNTGYDIAACVFDENKLYLGKTNGYVQGWSAFAANTGKTITSANGKYITFVLRHTNNSPALLPADIADVGLRIEYMGPISLQSKEVTPTESIQVVTPDSGVDGLSQVSVGAISSTYIGSGITQRSSTDLSVSGATVTAPAGYYATAASKSVTTMTLPTAVTASATSGYTSKATIGRSTSAQYINIPPGYNSAGGYYTISATPNMTLPTSVTTSSSGTSKLTITPTTSNRYLNIPTGYNGTASYYTIAGDADLVAGNIKSGVEIFGVTGTYSGAGITLQQKTGVTPTTSSQTITADSGYDGLSSVQINAMPTMTLPTAASSTSSGTAAMSAAIGRSTSAQYINIPVGYNSTAKYYQIAAVANGSATNSGTASGSSATLSTGTNTLTLQKAVSITPSVTAGYISSGTAGNVTVSLTASVTTKAATTYNTSTSDQTIAAGTYLTGAQTIRAVTHTATAAKIAVGQTITIGDSGSATRIANISGTYTSDATAAAADIASGKTAYVNGSKVTGSLVVNKYYTGSSTPASSLGSNGDIYIQQ